MPVSGNFSTGTGTGFQFPAGYLVSGALPDIKKAGLSGQLSGATLV
jgi:hypothetical protein